MEALGLIDGWGAATAAAGVVFGDGTVAVHGATTSRLRLASISKVLVAYAVLVGADRGELDLDEAAGPPGATVRHLLAHASGLGFDGIRPLTTPGRRRIYSNTGFEALGAHVTARTGIPMPAYLAERVLGPLAMRDTVLEGSPAAAVHGTAEDLLTFAAELLEPTLVSPARWAEARQVQFPGLAGVLPAVGRFDPLDWGLGIELRGHKQPHWTGHHNSPATFGHFGGSGTFLWVDPEAGLALLALTDREFGAWAMEAWPALSDAVLAEAG